MSKANCKGTSANVLVNKCLEMGIVSMDLLGDPPRGPVVPVVFSRISDRKLTLGYGSVLSRIDIQGIVNGQDVFCLSKYHVVCCLRMLVIYFLQTFAT